MKQHNTIKLLEVYIIENMQRLKHNWHLSAHSLFRPEPKFEKSKIKDHEPGNLAEVRRSQYDDVRIRAVQSHHRHGKHSLEWSMINGQFHVIHHF